MCLNSLRLTVPLNHLGLADDSVLHGSQQELPEETGLDAAGIVEATKRSIRTAD